MKIQSINNVSSKGLPARKLAYNTAKRAVIKPIRPNIPEAEEKCIIKPIRKSLPQSVSKEEAVNASPEKQKKVVACGSWSDWCGGGFDVCGAYA